MVVALTAALGCLALSCFILSNRYYTSAAFERPLHFSLATLLLTSVALQSIRRIKRLPTESLSSLTLPLTKGSGPASATAPATNGMLRRVWRSCPQFTALTCCIVTRCLLFRLVIHTSQCAWPGIEALLPLFSLVCELIYPTSSKATEPGATTPGKPPRLARSPPALTYALLSLGWAVFAILALSHSRAQTGTVCPPGWQSARLTTCAQFGICALDAAALSYVAQLRNREVKTGRDCSAKLAMSSVVAVGFVLLLCSPLLNARPSLCLTYNLGPLDIRDLILDSLLASTALISGFILLSDFHPTSIALLVSEKGLFGYWYFKFNFPSRHAPLHPSLDDSPTMAFLAAIFAALLWYFAACPNHAPRARVSRLLRWLLLSQVGVVVFTLANWTLLSAPSSNISIPRAVEALAASARNDRAVWASQAASSTTLSEAVAEYKRRHGMPPPPNFDKWYQYAVNSNSSVIDDFRQIYSDILPFWGVEPSKIRASTTRLISYAHIEMAALSIQNGTVHQSPHVPGTHRWMTNMVEKMIEPFVQWLPDMVLAINLADECRVSVPFRDMEALKTTAAGAMSRVDGTSRIVKSKQATASGGERGWAFDFPEPTSWDREGATSPRQVTPDFVDYHGRQIYYDWIAAACPPSSASQNSRWWDWSSFCSACLAPHSLMTGAGAVVSNKTLAHDLCHQPDVAKLDGFISSPTVFTGSTTLLPVFSQSRVGGFSDVLIPSPWDFEDKSAHVDEEDMAWSDKTNGLYWRGSSTDGFAARGRWAGFLRARFVHEAYQRATAMGKTGQQNHLHINVSFVGDIPRCESADCEAEMETFRQWATMATGAGDSVPPESQSAAGEEKAVGLPSALPFKESWHFRHLMDMDGAGFSGRFLSFLRSHSLVYRAALFKTWYDERLFGWHDYVPVDVRLGSGFWSVLRYLGGVSETTSSPSGTGDGRRGGDTAQRIAKQGRESASSVLRREDMHVYMFRLLLEWGRVTNDDREALAYRED